MGNNLEALKQITREIQGARTDLQSDVARAEAAAWARLKETLSDAIDRYTVDNVRGLVDEIMEERAEAAQEANQQALFEREQGEQAYLRRHGHYPLGRRA